MMGEASKLVFGWGPSRLEAVANDGVASFSFFWNGRVVGTFECLSNDISSLLHQNQPFREGEHSLTRDGRSFWYVGREEAGHKMRVELERIGLERLLILLQV